MVFFPSVRAFTSKPSFIGPSNGLNRQDGRHCNAPVKRTTQPPNQLSATLSRWFVPRSAHYCLVLTLLDASR